MGETPQNLRPESDDADDAESTAEGAGLATAESAEPAEPAESAEPAADSEVVAHAVGSAESEDGYGAPGGDGTAGWCIGAASAG